MAQSLAGWGYKADFSLDSLKEVDRFIDDEAPSGKPKPGSHLAQQFGANMFGLGAYLGETIRRLGEGQWEGNDRDAWTDRLPQEIEHVRDELLNFDRFQLQFLAPRKGK